MSVIKSHPNWKFLAIHLGQTHDIYGSVKYFQNLFRSMHFSKFMQCLSFSWTTLRGEDCRYPIALMGVVDMFGDKVKQFCRPSNSIQIYVPEECEIVKQHSEMEVCLYSTCFRRWATNGHFCLNEWNTCSLGLLFLTKLLIQE